MSRIDPTSADYCHKCDTDSHICMGCGSPVGHDGACEDCVERCDFCDKPATTDRKAGMFYFVTCRPCGVLFDEGKKKVNDARLRNRRS